MSPRRATMQPAYLRDPGVDQVETIGGHQEVVPAP
jgi:hypothetical protein